MKEWKVKFTDTEDIRKFVKAASDCDFDVDILYQHFIIDAKSFLGVLGCGLRRELTVKYLGKNEGFESLLHRLSVV